MGKYKISEAEWKVMQCLWESEMLTMKQIAEKLSYTGWSYTTIRTMVTRLLEKGALEADRSQPSNFKYFVTANERDCKTDEAKSFLSRVFNGSISMMVSSLAKQKELSEEEISHLKSIIYSMDGRGN